MATIDHLLTDQKTLPQHIIQSASQSGEFEVEEQKRFSPRNIEYPPFPFDTPIDILKLQRVVGNRATEQVLNKVNRRKNHGS